MEGPDVLLCIAVTFATALIPANDRGFRCQEEDAPRGAFVPPGESP